MAYIRSGGGKGAETPTLLWTNSDPQAAFSGLTLNFSKDDYPFLLIEYIDARSMGTATKTYRTCIERNQGNNALYGYFSEGNSGNWVRQIGEHLTYLTIGTCYKVNASDTSSSRNIPTRIYGYKKLPYNI